MYKNSSAATLTLCGPILYELVSGDTAYLFYNAQVFTFWPKSTAYQINQAHTLRVKPTNLLTNDILDVEFNVIGTAPCTTSSYTANRKSIISQPS